MPSFLLSPFLFSVVRFFFFGGLLRRFNCQRIILLTSRWFLKKDILAMLFKLTKFICKQYSRENTNKLIRIRIGPFGPVGSHRHLIRLRSDCNLNFPPIIYPVTFHLIAQQESLCGCLKNIKKLCLNYTEEESSKNSILNRNGAPSLP